MAKWIEFEDAGASTNGNTRRWKVVSKAGDRLGYVLWEPGWRRYVFMPITDTATAFEQDCLRDIAAFIEEKTREHKAAKVRA